MRLYAFMLFLLYGASTLSAEYREDTFLFCLKPDQEPLTIKHENNKINGPYTIRKTQKTTPACV